MTTQKNTIGPIFTCPHCQAERPTIIIEQKNCTVFYQYHFADFDWEEMDKEYADAYNTYRCLECDAEIGSEELEKQGFDVP